MKYFPQFKALPLRKFIKEQLRDFSLKLAHCCCYFVVGLLSLSVYHVKINLLAIKIFFLAFQQLRLQILLWEEKHLGKKYRGNFKDNECQLNIPFPPQNVSWSFFFFKKDLKVEYILKSTRGPQLTTSVLGKRSTPMPHFYVFIWSYILQNYVG